MPRPLRPATATASRPTRRSAAPATTGSIARRPDSSSIVIGVFGPWGDVKTSVLQMMEEALAKHDDVIVIKFNPWHFQSEEQLIRGFFATLADPEVVHRGSPLWMHKAVYLRAMYFRREFGYSFIQWDGTDTSKNKHEEARGHLFTSHEPGAEGTIIGGCAFWRDPGGWRMQWVWLCPPARRSGALSWRWKDLLERYGDFELDQPLSEAMHAFITIHGTPKQRAAAGLP